MIDSLYYQLTPPILNSQDIDFCWVCGIKNVCFELHHCIPRNAGGINSPLCNLCASHHNLAHSFAKKLTLNKNNVIVLTSAAFQDPDWRSLPDIARERIQYLATVIYRSELAVQNISNKTTAYAGVMSDEENKMLKDLVAILGFSQHKILMEGLRTLHKKMIIKKKDPKL